MNTNGEKDIVTNAVVLDGSHLDGPATVTVIDRKCHELAATPHDQTQKIASKLLEVGHGYYEDACLRAHQSFKVALGAAIVGGLFLFGSCCLVLGNVANTATHAAVMGSIMEVLAAVVFFLHFKTIQQLAYFHVCLERITRYMLANSIAANIDEVNKRGEARAALIKAMLDAPMLPILGEDRTQPRRVQPRKDSARVATARA